MPGAMLTASHNPAQYNGAKLCLAGAKPIGAESGLIEIRDMAVSGLPPAATTGSMVGSMAGPIAGLAAAAATPWAVQKGIQSGPGRAYLMNQRFAGPSPLSADARRAALITALTQGIAP